MKTRLFSILLLALGSMSLVACQKDASGTVPEQKRIGKSVGIANAIDTRTAFDPEAGKVAITGNEKIHVYYATNEGASQMYEAETEANLKNIPIVKNADGRWNCSFLHADLSASAYDYFFVLPYSSHSSIAGVGLSQHELSYEQFPSEDGVTFDSNADILIGKKLTISAEEPNSAQQVEFARMFVPFRVRLTDAAGLIGNEKIRSVEFSAPGADAELTGTYRITHAVKAWEILSECVANANTKVKASYPNGLSAGADSKYVVWYIVNPTTLHGEITLTIETDARTLTCALNPGDYEILPTEINLVGVSLKQTNTTVVEKEVDLKADYDAGKDIVVGGVTINKTTYGTAQTPAAGTNLSSPTNAAVYFLGTGTYTLNSAGRQVLIAQKGTQPVVEITASKPISGDFICKGITLKNADSFANYLFNVENKAATVSTLVLDGCRISSVNNMTYFSGAGLMRNIVIRNCTFALNPSAEFGSIRLINFGSVSAANVANIERIEFTNNVVYSQKSVNGCVFAADALATAKTDIVVNNNTFINYICSSFSAITILNAKSIEYRNNLMWIGQTGYSGKTAFYLTKIISASGEAPSPEPALTVTNNFKYSSNANIGFSFYPASGVWKPEMEALLGDNSVDPFDGGTFSFDTETFVPADAYSQYGAQR